MAYGLWLTVRPQGIDQSPETRRELGVLRRDWQTFFLTQKTKTARELDEVARFGGGARCDVEKIEILVRFAACTSFNDVAGGGDSRTSQLALKSEAFRGWKLLRNRVDLRNETIGQDEDAKLPVIATHARRRATPMPVSSQPGPLPD
jgi:hypothetical protein